MTFDLNLSRESQNFVAESRLYLCMISKHFLLLKSRLLEIHYMFFRVVESQKIILF